jgi:general stress protein 13
LSLRSRRQKRKDFLSLKVGGEVEGKVDSLLSYGAFIDVGCDVNGLLHISRITGGAIENIRHHLNEGDPVSVHIIDIDADRKTMAVSMLDKKADLYLDRRMKQRMKKYYGASGAGKKGEDGASSTELDYFDQAIKELEEALRDREGEE